MCFVLDESIHPWRCGYCASSSSLYRLVIIRLCYLFFLFNPIMLRTVGLNIPKLGFWSSHFLRFLFLQHLKLVLVIWGEGCVILYFDGNNYEGCVLLKPTCNMAFEKYLLSYLFYYSFSIKYLLITLLFLFITQFKLIDWCLIYFLQLTRLVTMATVYHRKLIVHKSLW